MEHSKARSAKLEDIVADSSRELITHHATILRLTSELNRATEYIANQESPEAWDDFCANWPWETATDTDPLGYDIFETRDGLQIQREDTDSPYDNDRDAIIACINDACGTLDGSAKARDMLVRLLLQ